MKETKNNGVKKTGLAERVTQWVIKHDEGVLFGFWIVLIFAAILIEWWQSQYILMKGFSWSKSELKSYNKMSNALSKEESIEAGARIGKSILDILRSFTES